jgi:hypothetical protein
MTFAEVAEAIFNMSREQQNKEAVFYSSMDGEITPIKDFLPTKDMFKDGSAPDRFYEDPDQWILCDFNVVEFEKRIEKDLEEHSKK